MTEAGRQSILHLLIAAGAVLGLILLTVLLPQLAHALLVLFAAILLAVFLDGLSRSLNLHLHLPHKITLVIITLLLLVLAVAFAVYIGPPVADQITQLGGRIMQGMERIKGWLQGHQLGVLLLEAMPPPERALPSTSMLLGRLTDVFSTALGTIANVVIIFVIGFYLALQSELYTNGMIRLLPPSRRQRGHEVAAALGHALRWWLIGRVASMIVVGVLTSMGLALVDIPLVLALGFIAGLFSFVPYVGPILSVVPAILIGLVEGPVTALYVILVYAVVQFLEGNLITPQIQQHAVDMPPVALLVAQLIMGVLFGLLGLLLATPLAVVIIVLTQMLYLQGVLGDRVEVLGQRHRAQL